jgi:hypothetical protein
MYSWKENCTVLSTRKLQVSHKFLFRCGSIHPNGLAKALNFWGERERMRSATSGLLPFFRICCVSGCLQGHTHSSIVLRYTQSIVRSLAIMSMDNDIVAAASPYRSRQRHFVYHNDGPDQEFWESSYFIPGISGRPRCLTTTTCTTSTTQNSPLQLRSSKSVNDKKSIDDNSHDDCDSLNIDSLKLKDIRSWCSPSALRHGQELERFGENNETNESEHVVMKEQERAMEGNSSYMLPNVLLQKDDTTTVSKQSSHDNSRNDPPPSSALLCDQELVVDNLSETKTNQSENLIMNEQEEGIENSSLPNVLLLLTPPSSSSVFLLDQEQECSKKKTNKTKNLTNEQERMGSSLPNVLLQKEHTTTTTPEPSCCHRSDTDLCKTTTTMTIEEELRELLKFMHDNREGSLRMS